MIVALMRRKALSMTFRYHNAFHVLFPPGMNLEAIARWHPFLISATNFPNSSIGIPRSASRNIMISFLLLRTPSLTTLPFPWFTGLSMIAKGTLR